MRCQPPAYWPAQCLWLGVMVPLILLARAAAQDSAGLSKEDLEALDAIGYLGGYEEVPEKIGVVHHDPDRAMDGYNLYISGHAPEAYLADMEGRVLHTWAYDASEKYDISPDRNYWRRVHLGDDGTLYAVCDPHGVLKLDRDSNLIWASDGADRTHHDLFVTPEGATYTLGKDIRQRPAFHETITLIDDFVVQLDPAGKTVRKFPMLEAFRTSPYGEAMFKRVKNFLSHQTGEYAESFHTNTIEVFDGSLEHRSPLLKKGNILCCSPTQSTIWILDGETESVVWSWTHSWGRIHQPTFLENGNWLLFHNSGYQNAAGEWRSQVLEYTFPDCEIVWAYRGHRGQPESEFYSGTSSLADRLPNGNTLITVSEPGRAIEVTADKEVVWEFFNPKYTGDDGNLIATLFQVERVPAGRCDPWLPAGPGAP